MKLLYTIFFALIFTPVVFSQPSSDFDDGAVTTGTIEIDWIGTSILLSTEEQLLDQITVSPNPASDFVTVKIPAGDLGEVRFYNLLGQEVLQKKLNSHRNKIAVSKLNSGIYLVKIKTKAGTVTKKLVKY